MGATVEQHTYTRLADIDNRTDSLEDFADETIGKVRSIYRYFENLELRIEEQGIHIQNLERELDSVHSDIRTLHNNTNFLYRRIKLLLSFCRKARKGILKKLKKKHCNDEEKLSLIE